MSHSNSTSCFCGKAPKMNTSWTDLNPGRRFLGCEKYGQNGACDYFRWFDPPMCQRSSMLIPGLLRKIKKIEDEKRIQKNREKTLWFTLLLLSLVLVWMFR